MLKVQVMLLILPLPALITGLVDLGQYFTTIDLINEEGYQAEFVNATTDSGYDLRMVVAQPDIQTNATLKNPVLFIHGILCTSDIWFLKNTSTGFMTLRDGRPTAAPNARGNIYCNPHKIGYNWDYDFDRTAREDLPVYFELLSQLYPGLKIDVCCHSMGCGKFLATCSMFPSIINQIGKVIFLAPAVKMHNSQSNAVKLLASLFNIDRSLKYNMEALDSNMATAILLPNLCKISPELCTTLMSALAGPSVNIDPDILPTYFAHQPGGTSVNTIKQLIQGVNNIDTDFAKSDYGTFVNLMKYGSMLPPKYTFPPSVASLKIHSFIGLNDSLVAVTDALSLQNIFSNMIFHSMPSFAHNDFFLSKDDALNALNLEISTILNE